MTDEWAKLSEQLRRYRALLAATSDSQTRQALRAMIRRLEETLRQQEAGEPSTPPSTEKPPHSDRGSH